MRGSGERIVKQLAQEQAEELLGEDRDHTRRVRSAEGIRFAFSNLEAPGFVRTVQIEEVELVATEDAPGESNELA